MRGLSRRMLREPKHVIAIIAAVDVRDGHVRLEDGRFERQAEMIERHARQHRPLHSPRRIDLQCRVGREPAPIRMHWDARLSALGREQVRQARDVMLRHPVELVLVSPLTRAIETAVGLFREHPRAPPMRVVPLLRERVENSCDVGRAPAELAAEFPGLDFAHLPPVWWHAEGEADDRGICVEPEAVVRARVAEFRASLRAQRGARDRRRGTRHFPAAFDRQGARQLRGRGNRRSGRIPLPA